MSSFFASLSAAQKAHTAKVVNQATEAFPSMKDLTDALVGGSGWLQNPETVIRKRVEKHLEEEANLDCEDDDEDEGDEGDEGDRGSTNDSDSEFDLDLDSESEFSESDYDPGVCQSAAVQWLDALHPVILLAKHRLKPLDRIPGLGPEIALKLHQQYAVSKALWSMKFIFKGMILGDPPRTRKDSLGTFYYSDEV